eukprot:1157852-Pelagomonas_calceolata.AAC.1
MTIVPLWELSVNYGLTFHPSTPASRPTLPGKRGNNSSLFQYVPMCTLIMADDEVQHSNGAKKRCGCPCINVLPGAHDWLPSSQIAISTSQSYRTIRHNSCYTGDFTVCIKDRLNSQHDASSDSYKWKGQLAATKLFRIWRILSHVSRCARRPLVSCSTSPLPPSSQAT